MKLQDRGWIDIVKPGYAWGHDHCEALCGVHHVCKRFCLIRYRSGSKILSHMLTSHGGQIYIHQLSTGRSILDDPPSISEGVGGRVTDYRIQVSDCLPYEQIRASGGMYIHVVLIWTNSFILSYGRI